MYQYKRNQPKRREVDGPFKGCVWNPGGLYQDVPADKIGVWFDEAGDPAECAPSTADPATDDGELADILKKKSADETTGPDLADPDPVFLNM